MTFGAPTAGTLLLLILASLFSFAAVAKFLDVSGTRSTLDEFGVPHPLQAPLALALPIGELALALALLVPPLGRAAAAVAGGVLVALGAVLAYQLLQGRSPSCNCFGSASARPIRWRTVARNAVLASVAGAAAWAPSAERLARLTLPVPVGSVALVGTVALAACYASLRREHAALLARIQAAELQRARVSTTEPGGLPVGSPAPRFELPGVDGRTHTLEELMGRALPVVLLFTDPKCKPCHALLPHVAAWQVEHAGRATIAVIGRGPMEGNVAKAVAHSVQNFLVQSNVEVVSLYGVSSAPSAVVVRPDGTIGSPAVTGAPQVHDLVMSLVERPGGAGQAPRPTAAPA